MTKALLEDESSPHHVTEEKEGMVKKIKVFVYDEHLCVI
jgi:hypothetical protein